MRFGQRALLSLLTVAGLFSALPPSAMAAAIGPRELADQVAKREDRVEEFQFIRKQADQLGIRVWLFGGTAAGYLHYVKWDLQREKGDVRFQQDRFDYDFTNIYRSTQDLDIVADGTAEQIGKLAGALTARYPHFLGSKTKWEVRSLREATGTPGTPGYKEALLNSFDFLNQDTDSNSTGMIELTRHGEAVVRDLKEWSQQGDNHFLKDSAADRNTFYRSATHFQTARAKAGQNPEIFAAIRALTKAFQYELHFSAADFEQIQSIVRDFDPASVQDPETLRRLKDIGKKLFMNAVNLEYAWDLTEKLGLRKKLMQFDDVKKRDDLAWWMNKEPLRAKALGQGKGPTAKDLGIDVISHETRNFLAYESITRAHTGDANVFISRDGAADEVAAYGDGFYTRVGRAGAAGTGLTIRFHLNAKAREETDFKVIDQFILVFNKSAINVIPESLNMTPVEYFRYLARGSGIDVGDLGIREKLKRRLSREFHHIDEASLQEILRIVRRAAVNGNETVLAEWYALDISKKYPEIFSEILKNNRLDGMLIRLFREHPDRMNEQQLEQLVNKGTVDNDLLNYVLDEERWYRRDLVMTILKRGKQDHLIAMNILRQFKDEEIMSELVRRGSADQDLITYGLRDQIEKHPEWIEIVLHRGKADGAFASGILAQPESVSHPEWLLEILRRADADDALFMYGLSTPHWMKQPIFNEAVETVLQRSEISMGSAVFLLGQPGMEAHPEWAEMVLRHPQRTPMNILYFLDSYNRKWAKHPALKKLVVGIGTEQVNAKNLRLAFAQGRTLIQKNDTPRMLRCQKVFVEPLVPASF